jgi:hypothetical protein
VAESEWPGEELSPAERSTCQALVLKGWVYSYTDENRLTLVSPQGDYWRVKRDDRALPDWQKRDDTVAMSKLYELLARVAPVSSGVDLTDRTRRPGWTLAQVRGMVRQGYSAKQVVERTGWGGYWIADLVGPDGFYHGVKETG